MGDIELEMKKQVEEEEMKKKLEAESSEELLQEQSQEQVQHDKVQHNKSQEEVQYEQKVRKMQDELKEAREFVALLEADLARLQQPGATKTDIKTVNGVSESLGASKADATLEALDEL